MENGTQKRAGKRGGGGSFEAARDLVVVIRLKGEVEKSGAITRGIINL